MTANSSLTADTYISPALWREERLRAPTFPSGSGERVRAVLARVVSESSRAIIEWAGADQPCPIGRVNTS
jgi:hypothetical protein